MSLLMIMTHMIREYIVTNSFVYNNSGCAINVNRDLGEPQPLLLHPRSSEFLLPRTSAGIIRLNRNAAVELFCTHGFRGFSGNSLNAICVGGTNFHVNGEEVEFSDIACNRLPEHTARRTNYTCPGGEIAQVGYNVGDRWLNLMDICHNEELATTHWVHFDQSPAHLGGQRGFPRIPFIQGDFFGRLPVNQLYTRGRQRRTIGDILRSEDLARGVVEERGDLFLSRGHLAARTDYIFGSHQQATFYFLNAAPQWQTFNGGNWERVENGLRNHVNTQGWNVEIFTGTHGVLHLNDVNGVPQPIYLESNGRRIPVPKIFYKVAVEKSLNAGIVFVGVNNPYATLEEIKQHFTYCEDISAKVNYIPWNRENIRFGYCYACEVREFTKKILELPHHLLDVKSLLL